MSRRKKIMFGVLGLIIGIPVLTIGAIRMQYVLKKPKVIELAKEYLEQKYTQEMQFQKIYLPGVELPYRVCFSPATNSDLIITVGVSDKLTLKEERVVGNIHFMPDDYYMAYFELQMAEYFQNDIKEIWLDNSSAFVSISSRVSASSFRVPLGLSDQLPLNDMEALVEEYLIHINTEILLSEENISDEAEKILAFIQIVRESGYEPDQLVMRYIAPKTLKDNSGVFIIGISDWQNITTIEEATEQLQGALTKE